MTVNLLAYKTFKKHNATTLLLFFESEPENYFYVAFISKNKKKYTMEVEDYISTKVPYSARVRDVVMQRFHESLSKYQNKNFINQAIVAIKLMYS
jgi:hypothetical protein